MSTNSPLERRLAEASFALDEAKLYLDTHPTDANALAYYQKKRVIHEQVVADYVGAIGPISAYEVPNGSEWSWVKTAWPWQLEG